MKKTLHKAAPTLYQRYPPSPPCDCDSCRSYCIRPGWWTVQEASRALDAGYGPRMMLEIAPEMTFGVLSPAFKGNEGRVAVQVFAGTGCTFLKNGLCELFGTDFRPLECVYCHHDRKGGGSKCHSELEKDWNTPEGQALVKQWQATVQKPWPEIRR